MRISIQLGYTPRCPQPGHPFTELSFTRKYRDYSLDLSEIGIVLVDLWNFGWPGGPVGQTLGPDLSYEWGESHARRKREIVEGRIAPTVDALRDKGIQVFHGNLAEILSKYPQWEASTTSDERKEVQSNVSVAKGNTEECLIENTWPPQNWIKEWKTQHQDDVDSVEWQERQAEELCNFEFWDIPAPVRPQPGDLLVATKKQFHRLLSERKIRVLFYMGFETTHCVQFKPYGISNMVDLGYLCSVVQDCTTTYESAKTLNGLWRTQVSIEDIERRYGYSVDTTQLMEAVSRA